MLYHQDRINLRQEFPDGLKVEFFDESQRISSVLTAKYGVRLETLNKVVVRDSVVWKSVEGDMLETSELTWDERQKKVHTNKFVVVTRPDEIVYGHGFEADQNFRDIRMYAIDGRKKVDRLGKELE
jgi:LPS export ABC transporter protein LptC